MSKFPTQKDVYRVALHNDDRPDLAKVELVGINLLSTGGDPFANGWYEVAVLPDWMQRKLALLMMLSDTDQLEGVGQRIDEWIFWVYGGDDDAET